jgi:hypothetical protein
VIERKRIFQLAAEANAYNPGYSGGRDQEDHGTKSAQANSSQGLISKIPNTRNKTGRVTQVVVCPPSKCEALS